MRILATPEKKAVVLRDDGTWSYANGPGSVVERWKALSVPRAFAEMLAGTFDRAGVRIVDTGETLTCIHRGDRIEIAAGLDPASVDYTVQIYSYQAERLAQQIAGGAIDELERFRIAREVFIAAGASGVARNPLSSNPNLRRVIRAKNLVHISLVSPDPAQEPDALFSLIHVNKTSLVVPGLYGTPERVFRLSVSDVLELQRVLGPALKRARAREWLKIARWYIAWRKKVEVAA